MTVRGHCVQISLWDVGARQTSERDWHVTQSYAEWNALCWLNGRVKAGPDAGIPQVFEHGLRHQTRELLLGAGRLAT
ncbi:hypothetical protein WJX73_008487 [Symbiochloris irregularis]|uniref:Uncharacterized protein n=1 Tax=Symbiochloris irregularis TaxID=706552 RepID=A0AAW1NLV4_9CHLO